MTLRMEPFKRLVSQDKYYQFFTQNSELTARTGFESSKTTKKM